jgi:hypothetical protein
MKNSFFYQVKGSLYRNDSENLNLVEVNQFFRNDNPILARESAFEFYQNYIDVFLENLGKSYNNHEETLFWLRNFIKNKNESYQKIGNEIMWQIDEDFDKGLFVYLVLDEADKFETMEGETVYNNKIQIHRLDYSPNELYDDLYSNLKTEFELYEKQNFDMKNYKIDYDFDKSKFITELKPTLRTPIEYKKNLF